MRRGAARIHEQQWIGELFVGNFLDGSKQIKNVEDKLSGTVELNDGSKFENPALNVVRTAHAWGDTKHYDCLGRRLQ